MRKVSKKAMKIIRKMQQNELNESCIYSAIAKRTKNVHNRNTLRRLANEEKKHYNIWKGYTRLSLKPNKLKVFWYTAIATIFGFTFAVKLMEKGEAGAQKEYALLEQEVTESKRIRQEEEEHEEALLKILDEERLQYVGSMVLGMNDALVELTGSLAGFTFALQNTRLVALSGLIIGISATLSMASSEFLAARSEGRKDAFKSCAYTGIAYLITVILLILPYLLFSNAQFLYALFTMLAIVVAIIAVFTYYISVAKDEKFAPKFIEMSLISIGVAIVSFAVGILAKKFLGIEV